MKKIIFYRSVHPRTGERAARTEGYVDGTGMICVRKDTDGMWYATHYVTGLLIGKREGCRLAKEAIAEARKDFEHPQFIDRLELILQGKEHKAFIKSRVKQMKEAGDVPKRA